MIYNQTENTIGLTRGEVYSIIENNTDKTSKDIDKILLSIVKKRWLNFSPKQLSWLKSKLSFIFRHSPQLKEYKKVKDFVFMDYDDSVQGFSIDRNMKVNIVPVPLPREEYGDIE